MDRGNSLPCVLEQKVRGRGRARGRGAGDRAIHTGGGPAGESQASECTEGSPGLLRGGEGQQGSQGR